ncbi:MAG: hypothetical protein HRU43_00420 [Simkaniaceae bacterium]|nr:hypothetical protein [Simkaniaceae bacterium]
MVEMKLILKQIFFRNLKREWIKSTLISIFDPVIFLLYLMIFALGTFGKNSIEILGFKTFWALGGNVYALNPFFYIPFSVALYHGLSALKGYFVINVNQLTFEEFYKRQYGKIPIVISVINSIHLLAWFVGMEGNLFILFFPFLIISLSIQVSFIASSPFWKTKFLPKRNNERK